MSLLIFFTDSVIISRKKFFEEVSLCVKNFYLTKIGFFIKVIIC